LINACDKPTKKQHLIGFLHNVVALKAGHVSPRSMMSGLLEREVGRLRNFIYKLKMLRNYSENERHFIICSIDEYFLFNQLPFKRSPRFQTGGGV
jgi:hypothetical protein